MRSRILTIGLLLMGLVAGAEAQSPLRLQIAAGRVSLHAENVPVRIILAEWARLGGAKIVNGERIAGAPVTMELENVPERQALDLLLRGVSGYMLAARTVGEPGASMFDRIMILPTSVAPRNPAPAAAVPVFQNAPGAIRPVPQRGALPVTPERDAAVEVPDDNRDDAALQAPVAVPRPFPSELTGDDQNPAAARVPTLPGVPNTPPQNVPAVISTPSNPFGLPPGASTRPGVIAPVPQPQGQPRPEPEN